MKKQNKPTTIYKLRPKQSPLSIAIEILAITLILMFRLFIIYLLPILILIFLWK